MTSRPQKQLKRPDSDRIDDLNKSVLKLSTLFEKQAIQIDKQYIQIEKQFIQQTRFNWFIFIAICIIFIAICIASVAFYSRIGRVETLIRDETHLFPRNVISAIKAGVLYDGKLQCTIFGVVYRQRAYLITARHCFENQRQQTSSLSLAHPSSDIAVVSGNKSQSYYYLNLNDAIANVEIADKLISYGTPSDGVAPGIARGWSSDVYATAYLALTSGNLGHKKSRVILSGSVALPGMSGAPVFNGCGLVGVLTERFYKFRRDFYDNSVQLDDCTLIMHVEELLSLLLTDRALQHPFSLPASSLSSSQIITIPKKSYC